MIKNNIKLITYFYAIALFFCGCCCAEESLEVPTTELSIETSIIVNSEPDSAVFETEVLAEPVVETEPVKEMIYFSPDITFSYDYVKTEDMMRYGLFTPSTANNYEKLPLIVWLHGIGEIDAGETIFSNVGVLNTLNNWELEGFNAYVLCPQLYGKFKDYRWNSENSQNKVQSLIDYFIKNYNIDTDKIIISGHSLGAQGAIYMAQTIPEYFSALVPISAYDPIVEITNKDIPVRCYIGESSKGEYNGSIQYTFDGFKSAYGENVIFEIQAGHGDIPEKSFILDKDNNNRSDLIEWMFEQ